MASTKKKKEYKCIVGCTNSNGECELFPVIVTCSEHDYENGMHYKAAEEQAEEERYDTKNFTFDAQDPAFEMIKDIDWDDVAQVTI